MNFRDFLKDTIVHLDGGMGTLLQSRGLTPGEHPERWNMTHPEIIQAIHRDYFDAGSNVVCTNTFGANCLKFSEHELRTIIRAAVDNARAARDTSGGNQPKYIALDIGPTGKLLKPLGDLDFEDAVEVFAKTVRIGVACGVDLILIETMNDSYETKAALLAVKENCDLPVLVSNAYGEDGKLMTGATPATMVAMLEGMGADAIGANCSLGPDQLRSVINELLSCASVPVILKPNAGLPNVVDGKTVYDVDAKSFAESVTDLVKAGVRIVGGCCGTTPDYIRTLTEKTAHISPVPVTDKNITAVSSYTHAVVFGDSPILIGERINPTGKKRFKQALLEKDMDYLRKAACEYIPDLIRYTREFYEVFQANWDETNKPFGSENGQIRLGGVINRAEYVAKRVKKYIDGEIDRLEELEQEVLLSERVTFNHGFRKNTTANAVGIV